MGSIDPTRTCYEDLKMAETYDEYDSTERYSLCTDMEEGEEIQVIGSMGNKVLVSKGALRRQQEREKLERFEEAVEKISYYVKWAHCIVFGLLAIFMIFMVVKFGIKERGNIKISGAEEVGPLEE